FSSRRRHTRFSRDWSSDVCSSDLVVGDSVYGGYNRAIAAAKTDALKTALQHRKYQALHAANLQLQHPITKVLLDIEAPLPDDMRSEERRVGKECRGTGWQRPDTAH